MSATRPTPLTYHEVTQAESPYRYSLAKTKFESHIRSIHELEDTQAELRITFDDGHITQFENALPILERFHEPATFFITAGWTDQNPEYMSWNQLRELKARGYDVQSHGWSHTLLTQCSPGELERELVRSKNALEQHLECEVDAISMPGGRWNQQVIKACVAAGYSRIFTSDPWIAAPPMGQIHLRGRWMVSREMTGEDVVALLREKGAIVQFLKARNRLAEFAKSALGDRLYQVLWRAISQKGPDLKSERSKPRSGSGVSV